MSEEKRTFYKTLNNIVATNRIDNEEAYIINNYVSGLENIIKEVREYIERYLKLNLEAFDTKDLLEKILEILNKGE